MGVNPRAKNFSRNFEKPLDKCPGICYNTITKRKQGGKQNDE